MLLAFMCSYTDKNTHSVENRITLSPMGHVWPLCNIRLPIPESVPGMYMYIGCVSRVAKCDTDRKRNSSRVKYSNLSSSHVFYAVAMETLGALADDALVFRAEIGRRATLCSASADTR